MSCPCCGARHLLGVWLPRRKAEIVSRLLDSGQAGLPGDAFENMTRVCFKTHIYQINALLEETDWVIRSERGQGVSRFTIRKRK